MLTVRVDQLTYWLSLVGRPNYDTTVVSQKMRHKELIELGLVALVLLIIDLPGEALDHMSNADEAVVCW